MIVSANTWKPHGCNAIRAPAYGRFVAPGNVFSLSSPLSQPEVKHRCPMK